MPTQEETKALLRFALKMEPALGLHGLGYNLSSKGSQPPLNAENKRHLLEIAQAALFLSSVNKRKSINKSICSSELKGMVERWLWHNVDVGATYITNLHIANGCFIAAAIGLGFSYTGDDNPFINVSSVSVKRLVNRCFQT